MNPTIVPAFRRQAEVCEAMDSPLYGRLLTAAADSIESGGAVATIVADFVGDAVPAALALRLMGGVHRLVLAGRAPSLASFYPTVGGIPDPTCDVDAFLELADRESEFLTHALGIPPQTNEIGRSVALLPGYGIVVEDPAIPVHIREIGSAAGLNLLLDLYHYETDAWAWVGALGAPVVKARWSGPPPPLPNGMRVATRSGCDASPVDVTSPAGREQLLSFVWADQSDRFDRMQRAIDLLVRSEYRLDAEDAETWIGRVLADRPEGLTVVQHSVMWQYLPIEKQMAIERLIREAGSTADPRRPVAWVRFEPPDVHGAGRRGIELTVTAWPGGDARVVAEGHAHGAHITWLNDDVTSGVTS